MSPILSTSSHQRIRLTAIESDAVFAMAGMADVKISSERSLDITSNDDVSKTNTSEATYVVLLGDSEKQRYCEPKNVSAFHILESI